MLLSKAATKDNTDLIDDLLTGVELCFGGKVLGETEGSFGARDDADFEQRVGAFHEP